MSDERLRRLLNDYLDDRLEASERKRFEERLATDEALARQLALAMDVRSELRGESEDLSEAFYTRTVARFSSARRRLPFGVSWSTVGLAVATIAAAAIFLPAVLREDLPGMPGSPTPVAPKKNERAKDGADVEWKADDLGRDVVVDLSKPVPAQEPPGSDEPLRQLVPQPPAASVEEAEPERRVVVTSQSVRAQPAETDEPPPRLQAEKELEEGQSLRSARGSAMEPGDSLEPSAKLEDSRRTDGDDLDRLETLSENVVAGRHGAFPAAVELQIDLAGAGEVQVLDARDPALRTALGNKEKKQSVRSYTDATAEAPAANRFVAIGPHAGLDACTALRVRRTQSAWEISFDESGSRIGSVSCGIEIPGDGAPILFQGWPVDE